MPVEKIARVSGNPYVMGTKNSPIDHDTNATSGNHNHPDTQFDKEVKKIRGF